eukprot:3217876-Prymnesium_polylepis.1
MHLPPPSSLPATVSVRVGARAGGGRRGQGGRGGRVHRRHAQAGGHRRGDGRLRARDAGACQMRVARAI